MCMFIQWVHGSFLSCWYPPPITPNFIFVSNELFIQAACMCIRSSFLLAKPSSLQNLRHAESRRSRKENEAWDCHCHPSWSTHPFPVHPTNAYRYSCSCTLLFPDIISVHLTSNPLKSFRGLWKPKSFDLSHLSISDLSLVISRRSGIFRPVHIKDVVLPILPFVFPISSTLHCSKHDRLEEGTWWGAWRGQTQLRLSLYLLGHCMNQ